MSNLRGCNGIHDREIQERLSDTWVDRPRTRQELKDFTRGDLPFRSDADACDPSNLRCVQLLPRGCTISASQRAMQRKQERPPLLRICRSCARRSHMQPPTSARRSATRQIVSPKSFTRSSASPPSPIYALHHRQTLLCPLSLLTTDDCTLYDLPCYCYGLSYDRMTRDYAGTASCIDNAVPETKTRRCRRTGD